MEQRKHYIDNIRWITVSIVVIYHIIYIFNCSGVISNINVQGIAILDTFLIFVYPWFMNLLFVIAGMSSRYSLSKRTNKEFIKDRAKRILIPSIVGIFVYGWINGYITNQYTDMFGNQMDLIPGGIKYLIKYLIFCMMGIGPLWFCHVLFLGSVLLVFVRKIDKNEKLLELGSKIKVWMLIPLFFVVWGSSNILNMPLIEVYRFGIYLLMFLVGYYIFSNEKIMEKLEKYSIYLMLLTCIVGVIYVIKYYGKNYTDSNILKNAITNAYSWLAIISILSFGKKYLNFNNKISSYMTKNNFSIYALHYMVVVILGYLTVTYLNLPFIFNYLIILVGTIIILPILIEVVRRIPILNKLILGVK